MSNNPLSVSQMAARLVAMNQFRAPAPPPTFYSQILNAAVSRAHIISQSRILARVNLLNLPPREQPPIISEDEDPPEYYPRLRIDQGVDMAEKAEANRERYNSKERAKLRRVEKVRNGSNGRYSLECAKTTHILALKKIVARIEPREVLRLATIVRGESKVLTQDVNNLCGLIFNFSIDDSSAATSATMVQSAPVPNALIQSNTVQATPAQINPVSTTPVQNTPTQSNQIQSIPVQSTPAQITPTKRGPIKSAPIVKTPPRRRGVNTNPLVLYHRCISDGLKRLSARVGVPLVASFAISSAAFKAVSASSNLGSSKLEVSRTSSRSRPSSWLDGGSYAVIQGR